LHQNQDFNSGLEREPAPVATGKNLALKGSKLFAMKTHKEIGGLSSAAAPVYVRSLDECEQLCRDSTSCQAFSYETAKGYCFTTTTKPSEDDLKPNSKFVSGIQWERDNRRSHQMRDKNGKNRAGR